MTAEQCLNVSPDGCYLCNRPKGHTGQHQNGHVQWVWDKERFVGMHIDSAVTDPDDSPEDLDE